MADYDFNIVFDQFNEGQAPLAHLDTNTFVGNRGQASSMKADVISKPGFLTQSPGLADLTNGTQAGVVDQLIRHILDLPTDTDETYAIGTTKLFKLSSSAVTSGGSPSWPQTVTSMAEGESVIRLGANLYGFYNTASAGDILKMPLSSGAIDNDWGSTTDQALENAPHPSAVIGNVLGFGNGQYFGSYIEDASPTLNVQQLDFGEGAEVADVVFHSNTWWIAVNYGEGKRSKIIVYSASSQASTWDDELTIGNVEIGFLFVQNGQIYVVYDDSTSDGFTVGFVAGRSITPLRYFSGTLPTHRQKTLWKNTVLFPSSTNIMSFGASVEQLPLQISTLCDGGYANLGALSAPFGVPMIASSDGSSNHRLAKFSGYTTDSNYKSVSVDLTRGRDLGDISLVIVHTKQLSANARCDITLEGNQGQVSTNAFEISDTTKTRHFLRHINLKAVEDVRVSVSWANGDTTNDCPIRKIELLGNYVPR